MGLLKKLSNNNEPVTPITHVSVHPKHNHVIHCALGFKNPIDLTILKYELSNSIITQIPRFSCLLVVDPHNGAEQWKPTYINIDDHIIIYHEDDYLNHHGSDNDDDGDGDGDSEDVVNSYLADIAISPPMSMNKPLWELHILHDHKCMVFRVHHAVADGMSLMSLLWTLGHRSSSSARVHDREHHGHVNMSNNKSGDDHSTKGRRTDKKIIRLWEILMFIWLNLVAGFNFIARCLWAKDKGTVICEIEGVELWPRKVTTAKFKISDMKTIKNAIPNVTINDVLYGILWCGLSRYFNVRHPQTLQDGSQITGLCPVNIREKAGLQDLSTAVSSSDKMRSVWGNIVSMVLLPVTFYDRDCHPLTYTARAKAVMDRKKQSNEAQLYYKFGYLILALFGSKVSGNLYYNLFANTSFLVSNMVGPQEEIAIAGNPVLFIRVTSSSQPNAMTLHMVSYAGKADLQIQVAKEVIHDPEFLVKCFEDAFHEMKETANNCVTVKDWTN